MDTSHHYTEGNVLPCHDSPLVAPPPSPLHEESQLILEGTERMRQQQRGQCSNLADELSSSLATIAREERTKAQYNTQSITRHEMLARQQSRAENDDGGGDDASDEESWLSFLGTESAPEPPLVTATTSSSDDRYSSMEGTQQHRNGDGAAPPMDGLGLPKPADDRMASSRHHSNAHAAVIASLPPPQLRRGGGGSSSSVRSFSSREQSRSSDEERLTNIPLPTARHNRKRAPTEMSKLDDAVIQMLLPKQKKRRAVRLSMDCDDEDSSSTSGSDGGYDASSSDNQVPLSSDSPASSSEEGQFINRKRSARRIVKRANSAFSSVSSSSDLPCYDRSWSVRFMSDSASASSSESRHSSKNVLTQERKRSHDVASQGVAKIPSVGESLAASNKIFMATKRMQQGGGLFPTRNQGYSTAPPVPRYRLKSVQPSIEQPPVFGLGSDLMAHCMTFLDPLQVHSLLTVPLCKQWRDAYTVQQDVWRVLCLMEPFKAKFGPEDLDSEDDYDSSSDSNSETKNVFGKYRLLYTSFIRCLRYLTQIKDDAVHGRAAPSVLDYGGNEQNAYQLTSSSGLRSFLAKARVAVGNNRQQSIAAASDSNSPVELSDDDRSIESEQMAKKPKTESVSNANGVRYGHSKLTQNLLGPSKSGAPGSVALPWSCAIYSIVNWMAAFSDVEGIQTMCLKVLPFLLEDEKQRTTAQNAGLTDIVLRAMVIFPNSAELHTAAFHTIVLLARPLGGREGMLFHSSMVNSSDIFDSGSTRNGKSGIAVMLDSMERFECEDILQAMSCWSLVNIALAPSQKSVLVKLGGIQATTNAMIQHPHHAEVQFRALFALINLVIPSVSPPDEARAMQEQLGDVNQTVEKEVLDDSVAQIVQLVVAAMKHFCSSESILNRACLVLHNLSLSADYHTTLLWTKGCYQMLEWCLANYRTDQVLQQSAAGTLHRLQQTLSNNEELRQQFTSFLQSQQQHSLEEAHKEAMILREQEAMLANSHQEAQGQANAEMA